METSNIFNEYREAKAKADMWKKEAENLGKQLKDKLVNTPIVEDNGYKFERRTAIKQKLDEESLIEWLEENEFKEALKSKLVLDDEKVGELIVKGIIDVDIIDKFTSKSEIVSLYYKKAKGNKEGV